MRAREARNRAASLIATAEQKLSVAPNEEISAAIAALGLALKSGGDSAVRMRSDELDAALSRAPDPSDIFKEFFSGKTSSFTSNKRSGPKRAATVRSEQPGSQEVSPKVQIKPLGKIFAGGTFTLDPQLCFVLMPFSKDLRPIYDDHIRPTIERALLRCERADDLHGPTLITWDIWERINRARFLVADLTNQNPNVFYELGLAHAISKDVILLTQSMDFVPFDLKNLRCIKYEFKPRGMRQLEKDLAAAVTALMKSG